MSHTKTKSLPQGFDAMGKPIPNSRRDRAYQWAKSIGVERTAAFAMVERVANKLERDEPHEAREEAMKDVDLCGSYVLFAYLLTDDLSVAQSEGK